MIMISSNFIFNFTNICVMVSFLTKLLTLGISFTTVVVAKLVILGILCLTSSILASKIVVVAKLVILGILALRVVLVAKLVIPGILSLILYIFLYISFTTLYYSIIFYSITASFLTTSFLLHHLVYLNQQEQVLIFQHLIYLLYLSNCLDYLVHFSIYQYLIYLHQILN